MNIIILFLGTIFLVSQSTFADGFHNSTKDFTAPSEMNAADWSDPKELQRTWEAALVRIPGGETGMIKTTMQKLDAVESLNGKKFPTVIYLHGCSGLWKGTYRRIDWLAENGFAVIAPISFARKKYPQSCDAKHHQGGMYRPTLTMRQNDAGHAIVKAKELRWVDSDNIFLMGLSQGGITTATFKSKDPAAAVNARVVEGWTCHAGWKEYRGINAPVSEPVLTLVAENDPWFQRPFSRGDCGQFLNSNNGSKSVVYQSAPQRNRHELLEFKDVQQTVLKFLHRHLREAGNAERSATPRSSGLGPSFSEENEP